MAGIDDEPIDEEGELSEGDRAYRAYLEDLDRQEEEAVAAALAKIPLTFTKVELFSRFPDSRLSSVTARLHADIEWELPFRDEDGVWKRKTTLTRRVLAPGEEQPRGLFLKADVNEPVDELVRRSLAHIIRHGGREAKFFGQSQSLD